jgi:hypothetical protein
MVARASRGHHKSLGAQADGFLGAGPGQGHIFQGNLGRREQAAVNPAKIRHHAVLGAGRGVTQFPVIALVQAEITQAKGGENQLAGETHEIQGAGPVRR